MGLCPSHDTILYLYRGGLPHPCGFCTYREGFVNLWVFHKAPLQRRFYKVLWDVTHTEGLYEAPACFAKPLRLSYHTYTHFYLFCYFHLQSLYTEEVHKAPSSFAHIAGLCTPIYTHFSLFFMEMWRCFTKPLHRGDLAKSIGSFVKPLYRRGFTKPAR